jgi:hypothetical protein
VRRQCDAAQRTSIGPESVLKRNCQRGAPGGAAPPSPWQWYARRHGGRVPHLQFNSHGELPAFANHRITTAFRVAPHKLRVLDRARGLGFYWTEDVAAIPDYEHCAPLRKLLAWWMSSRGHQVVHAAAVGRDDGGVLIAGRGGSGKSTTALACLDSDLRFAGDDCCLLLAGTAAPAPPRRRSAALLPARGRVRPGRHPGRHPGAAGARMRTAAMVSVVIPACDAAEVLGAALASVRAQGEALEVIVVDDGSRDDTARVAVAGGARVLRQANRGPSAARNAGLAVANAPLIALLDADDRWPPGSLAARVAALAVAPDAAWVQGRLCDCWPGLGADGGDRLDPRRYGFNLGAALFHRALFDAGGGFDETPRHGEDVDLLVRAAAAGVLRARIAAVTLHYRRRPRGAGGVSRAPRLPRITSGSDGPGVAGRRGRCQCSGGCSSSIC